MLKYDDAATINTLLVLIKYRNAADCDVTVFVQTN